MALADDIRGALATVTDPSTGHKLVSSGQLLDVTASEGDRTAELTVAVISPGYPYRDKLDASIRAALGKTNLANLQIEFTLRVPHRPARQDLNRLPTVKNVIAVAAGKGGVGKSTVSTNLVLALQKLGAAVGILDADIYGPTVPKMLGQPERETSTAGEGKGILPALYGGIPVMSVDYFVEQGRAVIWRGPMIHKLLTQFLEDVRWGELDYLVVDLPPGTGDAQLSLGQLIPITGGLIVTTPQEVALLDVRKAVNMFQKLEVPILGVVENMSHYTCPSCGHHDRIFGSGGGERLADEFDLDFFGGIPIDPAVAFGGDTGQPIVATKPNGPIAQSLFEIAAKAALAASKLTATGPRRSSLLRTV